ncbi:MULTISPECIES: hypothetical protein [Erysipelothrix]|uniref:hypothetical protein n=1 Tax=Erysipelothrix TaxID=1647 RepID=UPI001407B52F|nr:MULTISPECIES: hypothetical protein [Erysipelothrix]MDV7678463.1 hypothetical protein [Erysipelothrix rhusiopathiae]WMT70163.1 hypothetical protein K0H77_01235 [Erysipelothrix rhusiopathiae]
MFIETKFEILVIPKERMFFSFDALGKKVFFFLYPSSHPKWNWYFTRPERMVNEVEGMYEVSFYNDETVQISRRASDSTVKAKQKIVNFSEIKEAFSNVK